LSDTIKRWSISMLKELQKCGEKFRRRYIEKEHTLSAPRMLRGTCVHDAARVSHLRQLAVAAPGSAPYLERKMAAASVVPSVEEIRDVAAAKFESEWARGVALDDEDREIGESKVRGESKDFVVDLAGFHARTVAPTILPVGVERKIIVKPKAADFEISGIIDLIDEVDEGEEIVRDLKTKDKSPSGKDAETSDQLDMYAMLRTAETGRAPKRLFLDTLVRTPKTRELKRVIQETTRDITHVAALVHRINVAVEAVKKGTFIPAGRGEWYCSKKWCEYYTTCKFVPRGDNRPKN
jgi:hypothetical protein